jgi:hypothetical protein
LVIDVLIIANSLPIGSTDYVSVSLRRFSHKNVTATSDLQKHVCEKRIIILKIVGIETHLSIRRVLAWVLLFPGGEGKILPPCAPAVGTHAQNKHEGSF